MELYRQFFYNVTETLIYEIALVHASFLFQCVYFYGTLYHYDGKPHKAQFKNDVNQFFQCQKY